MKHEIGLKGVCLRAAEDGDGRTLEGVAVPFGQVIDTWNGAETFDSSCVFDGVDTAKLCYQHGELIGRITDADSRADGLHITARISDTQLGRDGQPQRRFHSSGIRNRQGRCNTPQARAPVGNVGGVVARV